MLDLPQVELLLGIFEKLGTPSADTWPDLTQSPFSGSFPRWQAKPMEQVRVHGAGARSRQHAML